MHFVDLIDAATGLATRKWKRYAAIAFIAAFLLCRTRRRTSPRCDVVRQRKGNPDRQGGVGFRRPVASQLPDWDRDDAAISAAKRRRSRRQLMPETGTILLLNNGP